MHKFRDYLARVLFVFVIICSASAHAKDLTFCIPVESFDFYPFRRITQGRELAYLGPVLKSYLSTLQNDPGIIEHYSFSPDGRTFTARLRGDAVWNDNSRISPLEGAYGIAVGLSFRPLGERLKVKGIEQLQWAGWDKNPDVGIKVIDDRTFQIVFDTHPENTPGLLREALSSGSMHNRLWPYRLDQQLLPRKGDHTANISARWPISSKMGRIVLSVGLHKVVFTRPKRCTDFDMTYYPDYEGVSASNYDTHKTDTESALIALINPEAFPEISVRKSIAAWIRKGFSQLPPIYGLTATDSFFKKNEPGFSEKLSWNTLVAKRPSKKIAFVATNPATEQMARMVSEGDKVLHRFVSAESMTTGKFDISILSTKVSGGRLVFLQDILNWNSLKKYFSERAEFRETLKEIARVSANTVPPKSELLQHFEQQALSEAILVPLARRSGLSFTRKNSPVMLVTDPASDLQFVIKKD